MRSRFDTLATWLLVGAAMLIAGTSIYRTVVPSPGPLIDARSTAPPTFVREWKQLLANAVVIGDPGAPIQIVEFGDFECPGCKQFHQALSEARRRMRDSIAIYYIHYPLSYHRFARPAARAAECASLVERFDEMHDLLFVKQDSLGLKSWISYATEAGIADTTGFAKCVANTDVVQRIESGIEAGLRFDVQFTPTVVINGWRFPAAPRDVASLMDAIDRIKKGESPSQPRGG